MALRLLVTRPQPQADDWVARLRARGTDAVALPLLATLGLADATGLHAAWRSLPQQALVVFVSPNAVSHFFAARPADLGQVPWPQSTLAAATGPGTLAALQAAGIPAAQCRAPPPDATQFDSAALWAVLRHDAWPARNALVLRGDGGRDELASHLRQAGASVQFVQAYRRIAATFGPAQSRLVADALAQAQQHLWWLSSSEAATHLPTLTQGVPLRDAVALCSHPRIAAQARALGFGHVFEGLPTISSVLDSVHRIEAYLQSSPS